MLAELREQRKLTQKEVAVKLGVAESTISMYESGQRKPPLDRFKKLAEILGVSTDVLIDCFNNSQN